MGVRHGSCVVENIIMAMLIIMVLMVIVVMMPTKMETTRGGEN